MDAHAQLEIRRYAEVIGAEIVARWCPFAWEAFQDYRMHGLHLSRAETAVLRGMAAGDPQGALEAARAAGWLERGAEGLRPNRERREMARKLRDLGLPVPWD
jgi:thymidylate synthase (FAD)